MSQLQDMITIYVQQVGKERNSTICEKLIEQSWDPLSIRTRKKGHVKAEASNACYAWTELPEQDLWYVVGEMQRAHLSK